MRGSMMQAVAASAAILGGFSLAGCGGPPSAPASQEAVASAGPGRPERAPGTRERNVVRKKLPRDFKSIALEYTVVLVDEHGGERAVDPAEHTFRVGDSFLVRIRPQDDLYVYVFNEGPSGDRTCLLPASGEQPRLVKAGADISLPDDGGYFTFEPPAGEEKLVVVALPEPTDDVRLLASSVLKERAAGVQSEAAAEARKQADAALDGLREKSGVGVRSRGPVRKVVERVESGIGAGATVSHVEPPSAGETSSYGIAVTAADSTGPELVLDIPLRSRGGPSAADGR